MIVLAFMVERLAECATILLHILFMHRNLYPIGAKRRQILLALGYGSATLIFYTTGIGFRPYITIVLLLIYTSLAFEGVHHIHVLWCVYAIVVDGIVDHAVVSGYVMFTGIEYTTTGSNMPGLPRIAVILCSKALLLTAYLLMTIRSQRIESLPWRTFLLLISVPVGCWALIEVLFRYDSIPDISRIDAWLPFVGGMALLLIAVTNVMFFHRILDQQRELTAIGIQLRVSKMTRDHIEQMDELYDHISRMRHDLKNHFKALLGFSFVGDLESIKSYIQPFLADDSPILFRYIGQPVLDALIGSKATFAHRAGINFVHEITLPRTLLFSDVDLCILFGNLLDNAFDAIEKQLDDAPRFVHLTTRSAESCWTIICRNSTNTQHSDCTTDHLSSTKREAGFHGIGTRQIRDIAERTGGGVVFSHENYVFMAVVMLKMTNTDWKEGRIEYGGIFEMEHELSSTSSGDQ